MRTGNIKSPVLIIGNPGAGTYSRKNIDNAVKYFSFFGAETDVFLTRKKGDAETRARDAVKEKPSLIVAAGGDGTINDVTNGIALSDIPLAVLPMGSINVLSREVGIPGNLEKALLRIIWGRKHSISLGMIDAAPKNKPRYFLLMGDVGYGGSTTYEINQTIKRFSARSAFIISGVKNLMKSRPDKLSFLIDGEQYDGYHAIIGNVSRYAGNFRVTPDARLEDPELFICICKGGRKIDLARYVAGIFSGRLHSLKDIIYRKCQEIIIEGSAHIQTDGNYFGKSPVKIRAVNNALNLIF